MKVTVNNQDKEEVIDWNKVQLVRSINNATIVLTSNIEDNSGATFCGTNLESGIYTETWNKRVFKPFHGSITLQND